VTKQTPTRHEVVEEIRAGIDALESSNREPDGIVHDESVLWAITCLEEAIRIIEDEPIVREQSQSSALEFDGLAPAKGIGCGIVLGILLIAFALLAYTMFGWVDW